MKRFIAIYNEEFFDLSLLIKMTSCIYNTDSEWLDVLRENSIKNDINFWRKDQRRFGLPVGSPFYFKLRGTRLIAGRARFVSQKSMPLSEAWKRFELGNGVRSEVELLERAEKILDIEKGTDLNCLLLEGIELLPVSNYFEIENEEFPPSIMAGKFFNEAKIARIEAQFRISFPGHSFLLKDLSSHMAELEEQGTFRPDNIQTARETTLRAIAIRRGQSDFRKQLLSAYSTACAITGVQTLEVLEAAHIIPYCGEDTNMTQNGLLLRADWHTLFDLGLWWIEDDYRIAVSEVLKGSEYYTRSGQLLRLPASSHDRPSLAALFEHRDKIARTRGAERVVEATSLNGEPHLEA